MMQKILFAATALASSFVSANEEVAIQDAVAEQPGATSLTSENYLASITENEKPVFIKFYAPWCGHCKALAPIWDELAREVKECTVAKLDCTVETDVAEMMEVQGYPTLKLFADKMMYNYEGPRSKEALKSFCEGGYKNMKPAKLPTEQNIFDKASKLALDYVDKMYNIWMYEPTVMPLFFLMGLFTGFFAAMVLGVGASKTEAAQQTTTEEEDDEALPVEDMGEEKEEKKKDK